jgi:glyoxylase-like metal-dependent hydrolase (beta-lactamase superfamily II)
MESKGDVSRRGFLRRAGYGAAAFGLGGGIGPGLGSAGDTGLGATVDFLARSAARRPHQERFPVVASEPWGRILRVAEGVWALESNPLQDRTTLCNGGIIAGRAGVVMVEAFGSDAGARWMAAQARELTGRAPTHVVLTHHHGDHVAGLRGAAETRGIEVLATASTLDRVPGRPDDPDGRAAADFTIVGEGRPTELDLGDRSVLLVPRRGHTASDVTVEVFDASVVFCGDLVWNGMFPNYVDASPGRLSQTVRVLRARSAETFVTGHGTLADAAAVDDYIALLDHVEAAARTALDEGWSAEEAGARYRMPDGLEGWTLFNPGYYARAIGAWMTELAG